MTIIQLVRGVLVRKKFAVQCFIMLLSILRRDVIFYLEIGRIRLIEKKRNTYENVTKSFLINFPISQLVESFN